MPIVWNGFYGYRFSYYRNRTIYKNIHTDGIKIIEDIETQITNLFQKEIIPVLKVFLEENKVLIKWMILYQDVRI